MAEGSEVDRVDAFVLKFLNKCLPLFRDSFLEDDHRFSRVDLRVTEYKLVAVREAVQHGESLEEILSVWGCCSSQEEQLTVSRSVSMSIHLRFHASPGRMPVSFRSCRNVAVFFPTPAMS